MTSSSNSPDLEIDSIVAAVVDVAERSFFAFADPCDREGFDTAVAESGVTDWKVAALSFSGDPYGTMCCALPVPLVSQLFDSFTGRAPDEPEPLQVLVNDLVGELANMVCGAWLSRLPSSRVFDLGRPTVTMMPDAWEPWKTLAPAEAAAYATIDGLPLMVLVHIGEGGGV